LFKRVFFFEDNREVLLLQKGNENIRKYKFDYIFSDYENNILIANSINNMISNMILNQKNVSFLTFGEEKLGTYSHNPLGKTKFFFGKSGKVSHDSFFKYTYDTIVKILSEEFAFDNLLIDIIKINKEKFVLDYVTFKPNPEKYCT
jgi:hypothetical protein